MLSYNDERIQYSLSQNPRRENRTNDIEYSITFVTTAIIKKERKHSFEVTTSGEIKVIEIECRKN
jgi:hypothetical protein